MIHFLIRMTDIMNNPEHSREDFTMSDTREQGVSFQVGVSSKFFHWSFHPKTPSWSVPSMPSDLSVNWLKILWILCKDNCHNLLNLVSFTLRLQLTTILIKKRIKKSQFFFYWQNTFFHILPNVVLPTNVPTECYEKNILNI